MSQVFAVVLALSLAVASANTSYYGSSSPDCKGLASAFISAATKAKAESSAFVQLTVKAKASAEAAASAATYAATNARALSKVTLDKHQCVTAKAASYGTAVASALANATSYASAVATASGKAFATATAAAVAQGDAQLSLCNCPGQVKAVQDASESLATAQVELDAGIRAWAMARSARKTAASAATAASSANSRTTLQFCSSCGQGYDSLNLTKGGTDLAASYN